MGANRNYSSDIRTIVPVEGLAMNLSKPLTSLIPSLEGEVLTVLAGAEAEFTGAQIHQLIGSYSDRGVRKALDALAAQGIVLKKSAGAANLYRLNRDHLLAPAIKSIYAMRMEFFKKLSDVINGWELHPIASAIFGSAARADMNKESDIDLFLHRNDTVEIGNPIWRRQLTELSVKVEAWTGNSLQIFELNNQEIDLELTSKDGVLHSIISDGHIITGKTGSLRYLRK